MRGGAWMAWIILGAGLLLLVTARLRDPAGWRAAWAAARGHVWLGVQLVHVGAVLVARWVLDWLTIQPARRQGLSR